MLPKVTATGDRDIPRTDPAGGGQSVQPGVEKMSVCRLLRRLTQRSMQEGTQVEGRGDIPSPLPGFTRLKIIARNMKKVRKRNHSTLTRSDFTVRLLYPVTGLRIMIVRQPMMIVW